MNKYALKTNNGDRIAITEAYDILNAQVTFSKIKVLPLKELLSIFIVEKVTT